MSQKSDNPKIEMEMDLTEADRRECIGKATYEEIKGYIEDKYDTKVSNLYIVQVKQKHGIIERENFNVTKNEDNRVPNCPEEKEKYIEEALRYFGVLKGEA